MRPQFLDLTNTPPGEDDEGPALKEAMTTTKLAGRAVIRVVSRCNEAQETENLDLSSCQLMQLPEAVFHLMRNTPLKTCDLSSNVITKIPGKLGLQFSCITELNLSRNRITKLPDELSELSRLQILNVSYNSFLSFPQLIYELPQLEKVNARKNFIADVNVDRLKMKECLKELNLLGNPLSSQCLEGLMSLTTVTVMVTSGETNWDDEDDREN